MHFSIAVICIFFGEMLLASPFPISFAISQTKIVTTIPRKDRDFAFIIPGKLQTYIYNNEQDYYKDYQRSYFAITCRKGGWDCMRHYEILANGCIPYFIDLEHCPGKTLHALPKELILQAMHLPGVSQGKIDHKIFDRKRYYEILDKLLDYTRKHLTTKCLAQYLLDTINYKGNGNILLLIHDSYPNYIHLCLCIGLKELFGNKVIEVPKIDYLYTNYAGNTQQLYGKGFSYSKILNDYPVNRTNIEERIKNKEFDLILYTCAHHDAKPFYQLVQTYYTPQEIVYVCGEDGHICSLKHLYNLFLREYY